MRTLRAAQRRSAVWLLALACAALSIAGCGKNVPSTVGAGQQSREFPVTFASAADAQAWTKTLHAGGTVEWVGGGLNQFLVIFRHGSGVWATGIAIYGWKNWNWERIAEPPPPPSPFLRARVVDDKIVAVSERSAQTWVLYDPAARGR